MPDLVFRNLPTGQKNTITIGAIDVEVTYPDGRPCAGVAYELKLTAGGTRKGTLDSKGQLHETNIPKGAKGELSVAGAPVIAIAE